MKRSKTLIAILLLALTGNACTGATTRKDKIDVIRSEKLDLDPMLIHPDGKGDRETIDVGALFDRGFKFFSERRFEEAIKDYKAIIGNFPDSRFYQPALYNAGLAYERLQRFKDAASAYEKIIALGKKSKDTNDAYFRLATVLEELESWNRIQAVMTEVLLSEGLSNFDRVEAYVRRSEAMLQVASYREAADGFRNVFTINQKADLEHRLNPKSHLIVRAYFGLGRSLHAQVSDIKLVLPPEKMGSDLKRKGMLFSGAQVNYIRALSAHHPTWSVAAGYMIGRLYEDFYTDILGAEIPDDLSEEQLTLYFEELRKQIRPLMERAVQVYEKNISLSERIGQKEKNKWVRETNENLGRLRSYLDDSETRARATRFVKAGKDLKTLWDPIPVAQDAIAKAISGSPKKAN